MGVDAGSAPSSFLRTLNLPNHDGQVLSDKIARLLSE
jgi:hypothetical protein